MRLTITNVAAIEDAVARQADEDDEVVLPRASVVVDTADTSAASGPRPSRSGS